MDVLVAIDRLDDLVHNAKAVPMSDQVRVDRDELQRALDELLRTMPPELAHQLPDFDAPERLAAAVRNAKPVPLTGEVRLEKDVVYDLLDALRGAVPLVLAPATAALPAEAKRLLMAIGDLTGLVHASRGLFSGRHARIDRAQLTAALDELHRLATPELRRDGAAHELGELDRLVSQAEPARGDKVKLEHEPFTAALDRLSDRVAEGGGPA